MTDGVPGDPAGRGLLGYLERRPCLITTTMARMFDVDGVTGASPAQADQTCYRQDRRLDNYVIPGLIRRGHWTAESVLAGIERALSRDLGRYQHRWFEGLRSHVLPLVTS